MRIAAVVGNPKEASRTLGVANAVAEAIAGGVEAEGKGTPERLVVDLAAYAGRLFDWGAEDVSALNAQVAGSDILVVASPTFKATYTGMLKAFLDRYGTNGLAGTVAVPVMTGGAPVHALAPEVHLRPLLVELGASVPTRGLFVLESQLPDLPAVVGEWAEGAVPLLLAALSRR
jgi:FMN reductase